MASKKTPQRQYNRLSQAWYADTNLRGRDLVHEIMVGLYYPDGGTAGEFGIRWAEVGRQVIPRLEVYSDAWKILPELNDLLAALTEMRENISPDRFAGVLDDLGIKDATPYEEPKRGG